ncbi:MAG: DUF3822 family protein, partial [Muribaculaceae bacterium]|nr:DUF3822 family protein [Muribaculaceae bacterium]
MFSTDAIDKPRLWRLILMVDGTDALRAVVTSTVEDSSLLQFSLPLDPSVPRIKALEEAVYAAPVLLSDFGRVDIVVRTDAYTIAPSELDEAACAACASITALTAVASESDRSPVIMTDAPGTATAKAIWTLEPDTSSFLARTFRNPSVVC